VLLKRFSSKEERRRLVAGIVETRDSYSPFLGLENHLNYICRPNGELSKNEALGLAAFFNSGVIDRYFRALSGNTQVNAAEIRAMPMPPLEALRNVGKALADNNEKSGPVVERTIGDILGLSKNLINKLCEASK
jgi:adenine-specific DNA-methyltransferase